jgi:uncharacterized protein YdbL (DUF1318 family)
MGFDLYGNNPKIKAGTKRPKQIDYETATQEEKEAYFKAVDEFENTNKGVYFRNNVWWWRRLADYVLEHTKCVDEKDFEKWQHNDGHEVDEETAIQIANQLEHLIKTGHAEQYKKEIEQERQEAKKHNEKVEKMLEELRLEVAKIVGEEKAKSLAPSEYPNDLNGKWWEIINQKDYRDNYPFEIDNVKEFIEFARNSGGFRIC